MSIQPRAWHSAELLPTSHLPGWSCSQLMLIEIIRMGCSYGKRRGCEKKHRKLSQPPPLCTVNSKSKSAKEQTVCAATWVWSLPFIFTKRPRGPGQSGEAESPQKLQFPRFRCDYAFESPPQPFWHQDQAMTPFPFVLPHSRASTCQFATQDHELDQGTKSTK